MTQRLWAGPAAQVSAQKPHLVEWAGGEIAVFRVNGAFYALDNLCPHKEAPLVAGSQVFEDGQTWVSCPWHRFLFDPATGRCDRAGFDTRAYPVTIEEGQLYIQVC